MSKEQKETTVAGELIHAASGLTVDIFLHEGKRPYFTARIHGIEFRNANREKIEQQIGTTLDGIAALDWSAVIEAYTRFAAFGISFLSVDRYWVLQIPAGDLLWANWRTPEHDDNRGRLQRAYIANLPPGFGPLPFVEKNEQRQRVWMPYSEAAWERFQQSVGRLRLSASPPVENATAEASTPTLFMPRRVTRYEIHYKMLEKLILEHLEVEYLILAGEHWAPDSSNVLQISMDGYDDSDRSVIEQIRSGERCYYALEMLMRVLAEKHVLPEGAYLITARQES